MKKALVLAAAIVAAQIGAAQAGDVLGLHFSPDNPEGTAYHVRPLGREVLGKSGTRVVNSTISLPRPCKAPAISLVPDPEGTPERMALMVMACDDTTHIIKFTLGQTSENPR